MRARARDGDRVSGPAHARSPAEGPGCGRMPGMELLDAAATADHYRSVAEVVVHHLTGRPVISAGWSVSGPAVVASPAALAEAVDFGCRWFAVPAEALRPWSL